jgi:uncharacterized repeat protein (TIGR03803 family)
MTETQRVAIVTGAAGGIGRAMTKALLLTAICLAQLFEPNLGAADPTLDTLHSFTGPPDGSAPLARLIFDGSGALYGTTSEGGPINAGCLPDRGIVFKLTPATEGGPWAETVLHSFTGKDGAAPQAGLIFDKSGALYGTTAIGGDNNLGTLFMLTPPATEGGGWTESVLHSFGGSTGAFPRAGLIFDDAGALYGTTGGGGLYGTVFKLSPPTASGSAWTYNLLHKFSGPDGANPAAGLLFDRSRTLYGTTASGGMTGSNCAGGCGTVFKLTPPSRSAGTWTETVLHSFTRRDGALPTGSLIFDKSGALYGTTRFGGAYNQGTVFKLQRRPLTPGAWTLSVLYNFSGNLTRNDGAQPQSDLIFDETGALFGTTQFGGGRISSCNNPEGCGTAFKLTPPIHKRGAWTETVLHRFTRDDGAFPIPGLIVEGTRDDNDKSSHDLRSHRAIYGTTFAGGPKRGNCVPNGPNICGTVFRLNLSMQ